jgi:ribonucleotide monophosphatase NagD (HAD superfamily)
VRLREKWFWLAQQVQVAMTSTESIRKKAGFIIDMDGVIYHGNRLLPGVTAESDLQKFAYRPDHILPNVGAIVA